MYNSAMLDQLAGLVAQLKSLDLKNVGNAKQALNLVSQISAWAPAITLEINALSDSAAQVKYFDALALHLNVVIPSCKEDKISIILRLLDSLCNIAAIQGKITPLIETTAAQLGKNFRQAASDNKHELLKTLFETSTSACILKLPETTTPETAKRMIVNSAGPEAGKTALHLVMWKGNVLAAKTLLSPPLLDFIDLVAVNNKESKTPYTLAMAALPKSEQLTQCLRLLKAALIQRFKQLVASGAAIAGFMEKNAAALPELLYNGEDALLPTCLAEQNWLALRSLSSLGIYIDKPLNIPQYPAWHQKNISIDMLVKNPGDLAAYLQQYPETILDLTSSDRNNSPIMLMCFIDLTKSSKNISVRLEILEKYLNAHPEKHWVNLNLVIMMKNQLNITVNRSIAEEFIRRLYAQGLDYNAEHIKRCQAIFKRLIENQRSHGGAQAYVDLFITSDIAPRQRSLFHWLLLYNERDLCEDLLWHQCQYDKAFVTKAGQKNVIAHWLDSFRYKKNPPTAENSIISEYICTSMMDSSDKEGTQKFLKSFESILQLDDSATKTRAAWVLDDLSLELVSAVPLLEKIKPMEVMEAMETMETILYISSLFARLNLQRFCSFRVFLLARVSLIAKLSLQSPPDHNKIVALCEAGLRDLNSKDYLFRKPKGLKRFFSIQPIKTRSNELTASYGMPFFDYDSPVLFASRTAGRQMLELIMAHFQAQIKFHQSQLNQQQKTQAERQRLQKLKKLRLAADIRQPAERLKKEELEKQRANPPENYAHFFVTGKAQLQLAAPSFQNDNDIAKKFSMACDGFLVSESPAERDNCRITLIKILYAPFSRTLLKPAMFEEKILNIVNSENFLEQQVLLEFLLDTGMNSHLLALQIINLNALTKILVDYFEQNTNTVRKEEIIRRCRFFSRNKYSKLWAMVYQHLVEEKVDSKEIDEKRVNNRKQAAERLKAMCPHLLPLQIRRDEAEKQERIIRELAAAHRAAQGTEVKEPPLLFEAFNVLVPLPPLPPEMPVAAPIMRPPLITRRRSFGDIFQPSPVNFPPERPSSAPPELYAPQLIPANRVVVPPPLSAAEQPAISRPWDHLTTIPEVVKKVMRFFNVCYLQGETVCGLLLKEKQLRGANFKVENFYLVIATLLDIDNLLAEVISKLSPSGMRFHISINESSTFYLDLSVYEGNETFNIYITPFQVSDGEELFRRVPGYYRCLSAFVDANGQFFAPPGMAVQQIKNDIYNNKLFLTTEIDMWVILRGCSIVAKLGFSFQQRNIILKYLADFNIATYNNPQLLYNYLVWNLSRPYGIKFFQSITWRCPEPFESIHRYQNRQACILSKIIPGAEFWIDPRYNQNNKDFCSWLRDTFFPSIQRSNVTLESLQQQLLQKLSEALVSSFSLIMSPYVLVQYWQNPNYYLVPTYPAYYVYY